MEEFTIEEVCSGGQVTCESAGEYTLPDYMPEVRRVLRVDAEPCITGQYENGDKTEVGGEMRYTILYCDADGHLAAADLDGTFEEGLSIPQGAPKLVTAHLDNVTCRLAGPRRLSLGARVSLHTDAYERKTVTPPDIDEGVGEVEKLYRPICMATTEYFHASDLALTDSVKVEEGTEILACDGKVLVREVKCEEGSVRVRGEVWLSALGVGEGHVPMTIGCKIPFEETIVSDGVKPDFHGIAWASCTRVSCEVGESASGRNAIFDVTIAIDGMAVHNDIKEAVSDMYAISCNLKTKSENIKCRYYPVMQMANFTVDGSVPREALGVGDEPMRPVEAKAVIATASCTADGAVAVVEGDMRVSCIFACDISDGGYRSETFAIPYKVRVNCGGVISPNTKLTCDVTCISCRARSDGARLGVDGEISVTVIGTEETAEEIITEATCDMDAPMDCATDEIIAAYLSDGDSLWSIGKRYHVPLAEIVHANSLPDDVMESPAFEQHLDGLSRLMIM